MSNVFSKAWCRVCSVIVSESEVSVVVVMKGGWFDPVTSTIVSVSHHKLPWAFTMVSVTVINKVGIDKMQIVNCMFVPTAKCDVKMLVT